MTKCFNCLNDCGECPLKLHYEYGTNPKIFCSTSCFIKFRTQSKRILFPKDLDNVCTLCGLVFDYMHMVRLYFRKNDDDYLYNFRLTAAAPLAYRYILSIDICSTCSDAIASIKTYVDIRWYKNIIIISEIPLYLPVICSKAVEFKKLSKSGALFHKWLEGTFALNTCYVQKDSHSKKYLEDLQHMDNIVEFLASSLVCKIDNIDKILSEFVEQDRDSLRKKLEQTIEEQYLVFHDVVPFPTVLIETTMDYFNQIRTLKGFLKKLNL